MSTLGVPYVGIGKANSSVSDVELSCVEGVLGRLRHLLLDPADDVLLATRAANGRADAAGDRLAAAAHGVPPFVERELTVKGMAVELLG